jgi:hypothetical protein
VTASSETPPEVPEGVLVQSIVVDEQGDPAGYRIFGDGRYQSLLRDRGWVDQAPLDAARLEAVERAVAGAPLDDLAGRYEGAVGDGEPQVLWMQVARGESVRTVSVVGERRVPELEQLTAALLAAFRG